MSVRNPIDVADVLIHGAEELLPGFPQSFGIGQLFHKTLARRVDTGPTLGESRQAFELQSPPGVIEKEHAT